MGAEVAKEREAYRRARLSRLTANRFKKRLHDARLLPFFEVRMHGQAEHAVRYAF